MKLFTGLFVKAFFSDTVVDIKKKKKRKKEKEKVNVCGIKKVKKWNEKYKKKKNL
jgi:hypothetical protein